jgi:hypothetical protein
MTDTGTVMTNTNFKLRIEYEIFAYSTFMAESESEARLSSILRLSKGKPTVEVQGLPGPSSQATSTPSMPSLKLRLCCVIDGEGLVFPVDIPTQVDVVDLKKEIQSERAQDILQDVGPHTLELWKVPIMDEYVM